MKYKYVLQDFEVIQTHIPRDSDDSYITREHFKAVPGYEIFKLTKWLFGKPTKPYAPEIRRENLQDIKDWLKVETGASYEEITKYLK